MLNCPKRESGNGVAGRTRSHAPHELGDILDKGAISQESDDRKAAEGRAMLLEKTSYLTRFFPKWFFSAD